MTAKQVKRSLPETLKRMIAKKGWSEAELARQASVTPQTINNICSGSHEPRASVLTQIADALGVTPNDLLGYKDKSGKNQKKLKLSA